MYGNAGLKGRIMLWLIKNPYPMADRIIAISKDVKTSLERVGVDSCRMVVIHNFIDHRVIDGSKGPTLPIPQDKRVIISEGRLVEQKDFPSLLRAFAIVRLALDARLVIIGEGPLRKQLERLAGRLKVAGDVLFTGWLANPFGADPQASVFVLCSRYEGFGNVIVEAMACGLPVICTDSPGGPAEILGNGAFGKLVGVGDVREIADSILEVLIDPVVQETMRRQSLIRANAYRVETLAPRYLEGLDASPAPGLLPSPEI
ncbi:glycosyltransferase [Desulfosarcina alkanivorans]|nr:glycosyltransferase [Desulfosarcina alkanivorans]